MGIYLLKNVADAESLIKTAIQTKYPDHRFLGEETYAKGQSREYLVDEKPTWCVDPLDGIHPFHSIYIYIQIRANTKQEP